MKKWLIAIGGSLLLAGCADCSRDPSQVGLACAAKNTMDGTYREDDAKIQRQIAALEARREALEAESVRLQEEAQALRGQRRAAARRLSRLNAETAEMNRRLAELSRRDAADPARVAALREREQNLSRAVLDADEGSATQAEIARLEAERASIMASIQQLLDVS